jgi:hypothetical protein
VAVDVAVWRDQENLYAGQSWPGAIGEAIDQQDMMILLWSAAAATSHFVEFEWNTALALIKPIVPVQIDSTPLPPSLRIFNAVSMGNVEKAAQKIALTPRSQEDDKLRGPDDVLGKLKGIRSQSTDEMISQAKTIFQQHAWQVDGNVYLVSGTNVNVTLGSEDKEHNEKKKWWELWGVWAGIVLVTVSLVTAIISLPKVFRDNFPQKEIIKLDGIVLDTLGAPVAGAVVTIDLLPGTADTTTTMGGFLFSKVPGHPGDRVRVFVADSGYKKRDLYCVLPGPARITLEK